VRHLHQDEVLGRNGGVEAETLIELQNNSEQSLRIALPDGARLKRIKVDGENVNPTSDRTSGASTLQIHLGEVGKQRGDEPFQVRIRYDIPREALGAFGSLELQPVRFPLGGEGQPAEVPVARFTRSLYLPDEAVYVSFDSTASKEWKSVGLWATLAHELGIPTADDQADFQRGAGGVLAAVERLRNLAPRGGDAFYPRLELPGRPPYLFESTDGAAEVSVSYVGRPLYYFLAALALLAVVGGGLFLESRKVVSLGPFALLSALVVLLGAATLGEAWQPFLASGLVGASGLGFLFLARSVWGELVAERGERAKARGDVEAQVAAQQARAAEAEARLTAPSAES
jgi:hypothetical protein